MATGTKTTYTNSASETIFTGTISTGFVVTNNTFSDIEIELTSDIAVIVKSFSSVQFMITTGAITATGITCDGFETTGELYFINL